MFEGVDACEIVAVATDPVVGLEWIEREVVQLRLSFAIDGRDIVGPLRLVLICIKLNVLAVPEVGRANGVPHRLRVSRRRTGCAFLG